MATRFGGPTPLQSYVVKMRWIVGGLTLMTIFLLLAIVYIAREKDKTEEVEVTKEEAAPMVDPLTAQGVEILVTNTRIEEGTMFGPNLFNKEVRPSNQIPEGAVYAEELPKINKKYAVNLINVNTPLLWQYVGETPPISALSIPPGYRAVTIYVDSRGGIEGWAKPNSRVDILWTFVDRDGRKKVATIVRYCKVLSFGGTTQGGKKINIQKGSTTVTLLVSERDARKVELARTSGSLSLSLVGEKEDVRDDEAQPEIIDLHSIIERPNSEEDSISEVPADGVMYTKDPKTGFVVRYELHNGRWRRAMD